MFQILLVVIYLAFISLGLPDSLLGAAWPSMYQTLGAGVSWAGAISMIIAGGTIVSSLLSDRLIRRLGAGPVTALSVAMTAVALAGFSRSAAFWQLCLWAVPYGLGAGSVDAALNNFVALHYKSRHMSWLHCFWGVGATAGPYIMGLCLTRGLGWNAGYLAICLIQVGLTIVVVLSLPLWKKTGRPAAAEASASPAPGLRATLALPGAKSTMAAFFCYCALEATTGLWAGSYLALFKGASPEESAKWAALFYLGITVGRLVSGFVTDRLGDGRMVRLGQGAALAGAALLLAPLDGAITLLGLLLVGVGCAPIFPSLLHATPERFGAENSQAVMGMQMACAYVGTTFIPPLFGLLSNGIGIGVLPLCLLLFIGLMILMTERANRLRRT